MKNDEYWRKQDCAHEDCYFGKDIKAFWSIPVGVYRYQEG